MSWWDETVSYGFPVITGAAAWLAARHSASKQIEDVRRKRLVDRRRDTYTAMMQALLGAENLFEPFNTESYRAAKASFRLEATPELFEQLKDWEYARDHVFIYHIHNDEPVNELGEPMLYNYDGPDPREAQENLKQAIRIELDRYSLHDQKLELVA